MALERELEFFLAPFDLTSKQTTTFLKNEQPKQSLRSKSAERRQTEVGGPSNPQQSQEPCYISDPNLHYEQNWNPIPTHNPLVVMGAQESEDDEATPSVVKAPPLIRPEFTTPTSGELTSDEIATLAHGLIQTIIAARSNPAITPHRSTLH